MFKPSHVVFVALTVTGVAIYAHQSEQREFEDRARVLAAGVCAGDDDLQQCEARVERDHDDCFMVTYDPPRSMTKFDHRPARLRAGEYRACIEQGFEPWREARNARRREEARLRRL